MPPPILHSWLCFSHILSQLCEMQQPDSMKILGDNKRTNKLHQEEHAHKMKHLKRQVKKDVMENGKRSWEH